MTPNTIRKTNEGLLRPTREATFSKDLFYRYDLKIFEPEGEGRVLFVMLNPSTADELADDPTIARCRGFARAWGFREVEIVNLFALRSTDPRALKIAVDPVGEENDQWIRSASWSASKIVVAWGVHGELRGRGDQVARILEDKPLLCLGKTKAGHPKHPLYLSGDTLPEPWRPNS